MNPITRMMKRYINMPLKCALPLLFIGAPVLVSISGCTSFATTSPSPSASSAPTATSTAIATPIVTATPTSTPSASQAAPSEASVNDPLLSAIAAQIQTDSNHHAATITWDTAKQLRVTENWEDTNSGVMHGITAIFTNEGSTQNAAAKV